MMMKKKNVFLMILIITVYSCTSSNEENDSKLKAVLENYSDSILYFDEHCSKRFEESFINAKMWGNGAKLKESGRFIPKDNIKVPSIKDEFDVFMAFYFEEDTMGIYQLFLYDQSQRNFIPLELNEGRIDADSVYTVFLYLNDGINCQNSEIRGSKYSDPDKLGLFERM